MRRELADGGFVRRFRSMKTVVVLGAAAKSDRSSFMAMERLRHTDTRRFLFIDTTGDRDLGTHAGCAFEIGEAADCPCQPMSLNTLLVVKDVEFVRFGKANPGENGNGDKKKRIREAIVSTGHVPSYSSTTIFHVRGNLVFAMLNHEYSVKPWDAAEITAATVRARAANDCGCRHLSTHRHRPRQPPAWLSLGASGVLATPCAGESCPPAVSGGGGGRFAASRRVRGRAGRIFQR